MGPQGQCQELGRCQPGTASGFGIGVCQCSCSRRLKMTSQLCSLRNGKGLCYSGHLSLHSPVHSLAPLLLHQSLPESPMERKYKEVARCRVYLFMYIHNGFPAGKKFPDTWTSTPLPRLLKFAVSANYRFQKQCSPPTMLGKAFRRVSWAQSI